MNILVYGAGVLGSLYAARLQFVGNRVSILARGKRLADLREHGIILQDANTGRRSVSRVNVVERLLPDDCYDWIVVLVRKNQLASVLPDLAANQHTPNILFMVNNAAGPEELAAAVGRERVVLGFPGAGGQRDGAVIRYQIVSGSTQPTTLGELDGSKSERVQQIAGQFKQAGFSVAICGNMDAWLKTHVALVGPVAGALYLAGGDNYRLARTQDGLVLMVRAVREGLSVLKDLGIPITPGKYRLLSWLPEPLLVQVLRRAMNSERAELVLARHANAARDEMAQLAEEFRALAERTSVATPANDVLYTFLNPETPLVEDGRHELRMDWRSVWLAMITLAGLITMLWFGRRGKK